MFYLVTRQDPALEPVHISSLGPLQLPPAALIMLLAIHYHVLLLVSAGRGKTRSG